MIKKHMTVSESGQASFGCFAVVAKNACAIEMTDIKLTLEGWFVRVLKIVMPRFLDDSLDVWLQSLKQQAQLARATHEL